MKAECMGGPLDGVVVEFPAEATPRSFIFTNIIEDSEPVPGSDILSIRVEVARFEHVYQAGLLYNSANPMNCRCTDSPPIPLETWLWQGML